MVGCGRVKNVCVGSNGEISNPHLISNEFQLGAKGVLVISSFWGRDFSVMFRDTCLPSLVRSGVFLPSFKLPIQFVVKCPREDWFYISDAVTKIVQNCGATIQWIEWTADSYSSDVLKNKKLIFDFITTQVKVSDSKSYVVVFAFPDHVFGRGLNKVVLSMDRGDLVVCAQARVTQSSINKIRETIDIDDYSNEDLVSQAVIKNPHPILTEAFSQSNSYMRLVRKSNQFGLYFKEPPPLAVFGGSQFFEKFTNSNQAKLELIDHEIPNLFFLNESLRVVESSKIFFWMELTPDDKYKKMIQNSFWSECAIYLNQFEVNWYL